MEAKKIVVTGIGGNVGQGIIRNILSMDIPVRIIGTNTSALSAGNHWVDDFFLVPYAYDATYIESMKNILESNRVDLIIPSTDYEVYYLSMHQGKLNCKIACANTYATEVCLDKFLTWEFCKKNHLPFADSILPSEYEGQFKRAIAKPRKGRGSKGIVKDISKSTPFADEEYVIQNLYEGTEITTAVYASYITSSFHGLITLERSLENGATTYCKVVSQFNDRLRDFAISMIQKLDLRGSFNIQSIVTDSGEIFPFEINCRISGTNSIRQGFGFRDVQYTIDELLFDRLPADVNITEGIAFRYLADVIYPSKNISLSIAGNKSDFFSEF